MKNRGWLVYVVAIPVGLAVWILIGLAVMTLNPAWQMGGGIAGAIAGALVGGALEKSLKRRWGIAPNPSAKSGQA